MTTQHQEDRDLDEPSDGLRPDRERMARELAALGESPLEDVELDWAATADEVGDLDVATTRALFAVAAAHPLADLTSLDERRVWKRLAGRLQSAETSEHERGQWRSLLTAVAMAAGVVLVARLGSIDAEATSRDDERARAATQALAARARASLDVLGGELDGARARALADDYAMRLRAQREGS